MRTPPYLPYLAGPPSLAPGLKPIEPEKWLLPDSEAKAWLPEKTVLMRTRRAQVFADTGIPDAIAETADAVLAVTGPGDPAWESPLERAAAQVSDDLCLLLPDERGEWTLRAASLVAPTFWSLADKIGQPLAGLHTTVPAANPGLVSRISRMFDASCSRSAPVSTRWRQPCRMPTMRARSRRRGVASTRRWPITRAGHPMSGWCARRWRNWPDARPGGRMARRRLDQARIRTHRRPT